MQLDEIQGVVCVRYRYQKWDRSSVGCVILAAVIE
jgi:hypothetical protein